MRAIIASVFALALGGCSAGLSHSKTTAAINAGNTIPNYSSEIEATPCLPFGAEHKSAVNSPVVQGK